MVIKLYKIDGSPPCRAVLMVVEILGLQIETEEINPLQLEQYKQEFIEKNPIHTIPFLEDGDFSLADSHSILTYLVSKYGADKRAILYPIDLRIRATVDQRLFFDASLVFPKFRSIFSSVMRDKATGASPQQVAEVNDVYSFVEKYLERSEFLAGDGITLADISLVSSISILDVMVPLEDKYPKIKEWMGKLEEKEWYQKANLPGLKTLANIYNTVTEKNKSQ